MSNFLRSAWDALKKVGAVVAWPFTHEQMIEHVYLTIKTDLPPTINVCKRLAQLFVAAGPDVLAAIAAKGFDLPDDVKSAIDLKGIAAFAKDTLLPAIEKDFTDLKLAVDGDPFPQPVPLADPAPAATPVTAAPPVIQGPGLHSQVPA